MSFVPAFFNKFNKPIKDLFSKNFDYDNTVTVKRNTSSGLSVETTGTLGDSISGELEWVYTNSDFGKVTVNNTTGGSFTVKSELNNVADNVVVKVETYDGVAKQNNGSTTAKVITQYTQANLALEAGLSVYEGKSDEEGKKSYQANGDLNAAVGMDGFSVGGSLSYNGAEKKVGSYNAGFRYQESDYNVNLQTQKNGQEISFGYYHRINNVQDLALQGSYTRATNARSLGFVTKYELDASTFTKLSLDTSGVAQFALNHSLADPRVKVNVASSFNFQGGSKFKADRFGLGLTFGDY